MLKDHEWERIERMAAAWRHAENVVKYMNEKCGGGEINFDYIPETMPKKKLVIRNSGEDKNVPDTPKAPKSKPLVSADGIHRSIKDRRKS